MVVNSPRAGAPADLVAEALALVARIRAGAALPNELHVRLQALRAAGDGPGLQVFTQQIQCALAAQPQERATR